MFSKSIISKRDLLRGTGLTIFSSAMVALATACSDKKPAFSNIDVTDAPYARQFELSDQNGKVRHLSDFAGKVVVVFFGYTQCPDVCPTTMLELSEIKKSLGKDGDRLQAVFVTVDPARDTPAVLKAYLENFDPSFVALIPTPEQLPAVAKEFKVYYNKVDGKTPTSYTMDHSAFSYIYDTKGQLRLFSNYGTDRKLLANDVALLLQEAKAV
jgi:protein SCO1/2